MRHTRRAKNIPVGALNGVLITDHQSSHHTGQLPVLNALKNRFAHRLARALYGVFPAAGEPRRRRIVRPGTHIAGGLNTLLPQPELVVKTVRVAVAMRGLEPHRNLPALTGAQVLRLTLQLQPKLGRIAAFCCGAFGLPPSEA